MTSCMYMYMYMHGKGNGGGRERERDKDRDRDREREREREREGQRQRQREREGEGEGERSWHLFLEDLHRYSSVFVGLQLDDLQSCHLCAGRIGPVGRLWNETDLPMLLPSVSVVGHDGTETSVLSLGATTVSMCVCMYMYLGC